MTNDLAAAPPVTAVVLCGGAGRRFGGDKTRAGLGGTTVLDHLLQALPPGWPVVCVGPSRPVARPVAWCREDPPGGGPVAALAAALPLVRSATVVVLGGDMPYAAGAATQVVGRLGEDPAVEAVVGRDGDGRLQPLLAAYRLEALRRVLPDDPAGIPLMRLLDPLRTAVVELPAPTAFDVDTPEDLARAQLLADGAGSGDRTSG